ncbi:MAG: hypothetical protein E7169_01385 [Firmicutes bacterium]|nr:hypothetical protein [Bacillota bacterium]
MKIKNYLLIFLTILLLPFIVNAKYKDVVAPIAGIEASEQVTLYLFHGDGCPHCAQEQIFLDELKAEYKDQINIIKYEVWHNSDNNLLYSEVKKHMNANQNGVPFTVVGEKYFYGYNTSIGETIKDTIDSYLNPELEEKEETTIPILGKIDMKKVSIPIVAIVLGFLDGFNPCAMWILLFLINMLFSMKNRKRMWLLGVAFLFTSAFVYFLAMLGLNVVLSFTAVNWIRALIGVVALIGGIINIRSYLKTKDDGCHIVDDKKRKKYFAKIKDFTSKQSLILSLIGVITLAVSVNLVELACSAGFPAIFIELLNINNLSFTQEIIYILIYILFFLLDDLIIFIIAMTTLKLTGISTKYNRYSHLVGGAIMIIMGILLILKPEWLMFNF